MAISTGNRKIILLVTVTLFVVSALALAQQVHAVAVGDTVRFTANTNLRSCAGTTSNCTVILTIPSGATASVVGGPQSASGYVWWNVNYNGTLGWSIQD